MRKLLFFILMLMSTMVYAEDFSVNGILYNILSYQDLTLAVAPVEKGSTPYSGDIVIPSSVTYGNKTWTVIEIMDNAFGYNSNITSVKLPSTLKKIGKYAFHDCSNSAPITIPDGVEYIGGYAFNDVKISGTLPASLCYLGEWAFSGGHMDRIVIPEHLKEIPAMTFAYIEDAPVTFNDSVESIGTSAFYGNLTFVDIIVPSSVKTMGASFQNCTNIETIQLPNGLTTLGTYQNLPKLHSINIPDSIQAIESFAFANDGSLKEINWPKFLSSIGMRAFIGAGIKKVKFPDVLYTKYYPYDKWGNIIGPLEIRDNGKVSIDSEAFANCNGLDSIFINDVVSSIGSKAFYGSKNVKAVVTTKETPLSINQNVFSADTYLSATLYVPFDTAEKYKNATSWSNFSSIVELPKSSFTLSYIVDGEPYKTYEVKHNDKITPEPNPVKEGFTFSGWSEIPETMPDHDVTVTGTFTINKYKLTYMVDDEIYKTYDVEYGATITPEAEPTKEGYTFSGWSKIPETMPGHDVTVTGTFTINKYKLTYMVDNEVYKTYDVEYGATITPEAEPMKEGYTFSGWSEIPETMPAHDVLVKGSFTQSNSSVEIDGIFYNLNQNDLTAQVTQNPNKYSGDLVIPQVVKYNNMDYKVTSIEGPGLYTAGAFYQCTDLSSVQLPDGLVSIGSAAFRESGIKSIVIPESVVSIGQCAFVFCRDLKEITLSCKLSSIEWATFQDCNQLTSIAIPEGVTTIASHVFANCIGLRTIKLPVSLTSIGGRAFANCTSLKEIRCDAKAIPSTNSDTFIETFLGIATLYVPKDVVDNYKNTAPWSAFGSIVALDGETPETPENPDAPQCAKPIIVYKNGKLHCTCETEDVKYVYTITPKASSGESTSGIINLGTSFAVSVYATREGYNKSETATAIIDMSTVGDVNGDGLISIADVTALVNLILGRN